jgi:hypothetical protein
VLGWRRVVPAHTLCVPHTEVKCGPLQLLPVSIARGHMEVLPSPSGMLIEHS